MFIQYNKKTAERDLILLQQSKAGIYTGDLQVLISRLQSHANNITNNYNVISLNFDKLHSDYNYITLCISHQSCSKRITIAPIINITTTHQYNRFNKNIENYSINYDKQNVLLNTSIINKYGHNTADKINKYAHNPLTRKLARSLILNVIIGSILDHYTKTKIFYDEESWKI